MSVLGALVLVTALGASPEPPPSAESARRQPQRAVPRAGAQAVPRRPPARADPPALRAPIGSTFTTHWLTSLTYTFHATEWLGLRVQPFWVWHAAQSRFSSELLSRVRQDAAAASSVMLQWGAIAAPEWSPIRGKFTAFGGTVRYGFVLFAGAGVGGTEVELKTADAMGPSTYGSTGLRMVATGGGGFRMQLGERWTVPARGPGPHPLGQRGPNQRLQRDRPPDTRRAAHRGPSPAPG